MYSTIDLRFIQLTSVEITQCNQICFVHSLQVFGMEYLKCRTISMPKFHSNEELFADQTRIVFIFLPNYSHIANQLNLSREFPIVHE